MSKRFEEDIEELKAVFKTLSDAVPELIKGILSSIFSEEAGSGMGKAVAAFYKEVKAGGLPDEVAVAMAKDYLGTLTRFSEVIREFAKRKRLEGVKSEEVSEALKKAVEKKVAEKMAK